MILETAIISMLIVSLISSSLITSSTFNIDKVYSEDKKAYKYGLASCVIGFSGLIITLIALLYIRTHSYKYSFINYCLVFLLLILIALLVLTYLTYDYLDISYHGPLTTKHVSNKTERKLAFTSFCFSIIGVTVGVIYLLTVLVSKGNFKSFDKLFEQSKSTSEDIELNNILVGLEDNSF